MCRRVINFVTKIPSFSYNKLNEKGGILMYYQNYEDYMRQVLGYPINDPNIYETYDYRYEDTYSSRNQFITNMSEDEIRSCYPEIYRLVYPIVCKVCDANVEPLTRALIEKMTDEVYNAIEDTKVEKSPNNRQEERKTTIERKATTTKTTENRQINSNLRDLIKILLLYKLFGNRPHTPPRPPRPPFPGGRPPMGPGRPPMMQPRDYNEF